MRGLESTAAAQRYGLRSRRATRRWSEVLGTMLGYGVLTFFALLSLYPLVWMFLMSLKTNPEVYTNTFGLPQHWRWDHYAHVFNTSGVPRYFLNSFIVAASTVACILALALPAGFAFGRLRFTGNNALFILLMLGMMIPWQMVILPLFIQMKRLQFLNTYQGLVIPYIASGLPFAVFLLRGFFRTMPEELADAARVDGCSSYGVFWYIMLPLARPAVSTLIVFYFMWVWNEFLWALVSISKDAYKTITVGIYTTFQSSYSYNWPLMSTGLVMVTIPIILLYLLFQRQFMEGLTAGALKGV